MRTWILFTVGMVALVAAAVGLGAVVPPAAAAALAAVPVLVGALGARAIATRQRAARLADRPDSVERERAQRAAADSFPVILVILVVLGAWMVLRGAYAAGALMYAATALSVMAYWVSYVRLRRQF